MSQYSNKAREEIGRRAVNYPSQAGMQQQVWLVLFPG
jgi:hypothetical protein